jgi:cytochrome c oxidase cbb3-type subunit III
MAGPPEIVIRDETRDDHGIFLRKQPSTVPREKSAQRNEISRVSPLPVPEHADWRRKVSAATRFLIFVPQLFLCYHSLPISRETFLPKCGSMKAKNGSSRRGARMYSQTRRAVSGIVCAFALLVIATADCAAQGTNPFAGDAKAAKAGESQFRANCAFCHGLGARGGGRGPDLTRAQKRHGTTDADLFRTINDGIPGTAMPQNGTTSQGVGMTAEEIWQVITYLRSVEKKSAAFPAGDAAHGDKLFHGSAGCFTCHMVNGKGGRLGPELTKIATARSVESLVDSVRNPSRHLATGLIENTKEFPQEYETVSVVAQDGEAFTGVALNEDNFSVQMMDMQQQIHLFEKDKLKSFQKSRESLMPAYDERTLSDQDLHDLLAYLFEVSTK